MVIKIFIDPGHNPSMINAGAQVGNVQEANITFEVANILKTFLENDDRFEVRMSRNTSSEVIGTSISDSLKRRVDLANEWRADYFISIHANANNDPNINGSEIYVYSLDSEIAKMARIILQMMSNIVETKDNEVRQNQGFYVLRRTTMPAMLIELAYMTNPENLQILITQQYSFALSIYLGILQYFGFLFKNV